MTILATNLRQKVMCGLFYYPVRLFHFRPSTALATNFYVCFSLTRKQLKWMYTMHLQIYATVKSGSLAIAASTLDSLLDLLAGGILWFTNLSMKSINIYKYPIGKLRMQPVGIIIFAAVMATLGMFFCFILHHMYINRVNCWGFSHKFMTISSLNMI